MHAAINDAMNAFFREGHEQGKQLINDIFNTLEEDYNKYKGDFSPVELTIGVAGFDLLSAKRVADYSKQTKTPPDVNLIFAAMIKAMIELIPKETTMDDLRKITLAYNDRIFAKGTDMFKDL